jgi:hypothetical protein
VGDEGRLPRLLVCLGHDVEGSRTCCQAKGERITPLDVRIPGELRLTLRGAAENSVLTTLRRWPHWLRAELEYDPDDASKCVAVTLIGDRSQESTLCDSLQRSFGLTFPVEGAVAPWLPQH